MEKEKESHKYNGTKSQSSQPAQMVMHDLQGLLEDLLSTNLTETLHRESLLAVLRRICNKPNWVKTRGYTTYLTTSNKHVFAAYTISF